MFLLVIYLVFVGIMPWWVGLGVYLWHAKIFGMHMQGIADLQERLKIVSTPPNLTADQLVAEFDKTKREVESNLINREVKGSNK